MNAYIKCLALAVALAVGFGTGWKTKGWKDASNYKQLQLDVAAKANADIAASKAALETKVKENDISSKKYETRITDLLQQLTARRVHFTASKTGNKSTNSNSKSISGVDAAKQESAVPPKEGVDFNEDDLNELTKAAVDDGARLEGLQDYVKSVCTK